MIPGETFIVTADGSFGHAGFVTNVLETLEDDFSVYYSCGPTPMLAALEKMYPEKEGYLSFEQRMVIKKHFYQKVKIHHLTVGLVMDGLK